MALEFEKKREKFLRSLLKNRYFLRHFFNLIGFCLLMDKKGTGARYALIMGSVVPYLSKAAWTVVHIIMHVFSLYTEAVSLTC